MALDPRTPVVVGVGQVTQQVPAAEALEPVDLMAEAARLAGGDAGAPALLQSVDSVRVVALLTRRYPDPGALVADRVGASPRQTAKTTMGGNSPQSLLNATALAIGRGDVDVALLCGAEAWRTRMALRREGRHADWVTQPEDTPEPDEIGEELAMSSPDELARGLAMPVQVYPLFEIALRAAAGRSPEDHSRHLGQLWEGFSAVAATNPYAWSREPRSAEEIRTPSPENRMIGFPYPKLMNSNNDVDQAAALLVCSVEAADRLGVPRDRWVFPHAGTDAHDHPYVSNRHELVSSPAIRLAGRAVLELAGVAADDLAHVDLYSCFPSAVQVAATELGLGLERPLTVTGGLSFAGGPWNNYVMHAIATMVGRLREDEGAYGLCTANGGYLTKHSLGVYSTRPPAAGFRWSSPQDEVDALPRREAVADHEGPAVVESYTVIHERDGSPAIAYAACLTPDGRRTWATTSEPTTMKALLVEEGCGRPVAIRGGGVLDL